MAITTTSVISDTVPTVIEKARLTEQFASVMPVLCWRIAKEKHNGKTVNVPYWGTVTASALTEGVDMANPQSMADTNVAITPAEVGAQIVLTWKVVRDDQEDVIAAAGEILGQAYGVKHDQDLFAQLDDATNSLGSAGTLTMGMVAAGRAILKGNAVSAGGPCPGDLVVVHHPFTLMDLVDVLTPTVPGGTTPATTAGAMTDEVLKNYTIGRLFGMTVYEDGNTAPVSNAIKGGVFGSKSIIDAVSTEWEIYPEDDASLRATELNVVGEYGVGEYLAGWIVELSNDGTTPA